MGIPRITTPKMVEDWNKEQAEKKANELNKINNEKELNTDLGKFTNEYNNIIDQYFSFKEEINNKGIELDKQVKDDRITSTIASEEKQALNEKLNSKRLEAKDSLKIARDIYAETFKISSEGLIEKDVNLLNSGIDFTREELQEMATKYTESANDTMIRLVKDYARKRDISIYAKGLDDKLEALNTLVSRTEQAFTEEGYLSRYIGDKNYRAEWIEAFKNEIS